MRTMKTHVLIGSPQNLFVFDYEHYGIGSAPFTGNAQRILESWVPVLRNTSVGGSTGTLYRHPETRRNAIILKGNAS
jgi:hypothetical protein